MDETQFRFQIIFVIALLAVYDKVSWRRDPCLQIKSIYASDISYMHRLKVVLYNILNNFVRETSFTVWNFPVVMLQHCLKKIV